MKTLAELVEAQSYLSTILEVSNVPKFENSILSTGVKCQVRITRCKYRKSMDSCIVQVTVSAIRSIYKSYPLLSV